MPDVPGQSASSRARGAVILLVDEADALAQSREATEMHHEDRAGVNAFIRGIDRIANAKLPAAVIMCTNRLGALDPAVRRRAADVFSFARPNDEQRSVVLSSPLESVGPEPPPCGRLGWRHRTAARCEGYGFTFSDMTQRLLPTIILDAYPTRRVEGTRAIEIARSMSATPPFRDEIPGMRSVK